MAFAVARRLTLTVGLWQAPREGRIVSRLHFESVDSDMARQVGEVVMTKSEERLQLLHSSQKLRQKDTLLELEKFYYRYKNWYGLALDLEDSQEGHYKLLEQLAKLQLRPLRVAVQVLTWQAPGLQEIDAQKCPENIAVGKLIVLRSDCIVACTGRTLQDDWDMASLQEGAPEVGDSVLQGQSVAVVALDDDGQGKAVD